MSRFRVLISISVFWLPLSLLFDGLTVLVLPAHLLATTDGAQIATRQGLITFVGLLAAMLIQPVAGVYSDRIHRQWGPLAFSGNCQRRDNRRIGIVRDLGLLSSYSRYLYPGSNRGSIEEQRLV
jgi:MFS family permease